ncbi:MAG: ribonuclease III [Planctomycetaceae bacterium]|nr:ribonuclease III [Planctomycetaceae bacterium]
MAWQQGRRIAVTDSKSHCVRSPAASQTVDSVNVENGAGTDFDPHLQAEFDRCQTRIGYQFKSLALLRSALTHASGAQHRLASNERLEFLGDAILGAVVCEILFRRYPEYLEGELTKIKSVVVSRQTCAKISDGLGLKEFLILGKGMTTHPTIPMSLLADVFESLVAAIYLDGGDEAARQFIVRHMGPEIELAAGGDHGGNYKSVLQQLAQREYGMTPTYQLLDEKGPDHSKCFKIAAQVGRNRYQPSWGRNKKEAEQRAALNALSELSGEPVPFPSD